MDFRLTTTDRRLSVGKQPPGLARARAHLDRRGASGQVTLIVTGGMRTPADCVKALALGADGIPLANATIQAAVALMQVLARACGHEPLRGFSRNDLASWHREVADLAGIAWSGSAPDLAAPIRDGSTWTSTSW